MLKFIYTVFLGFIIVLFVGLGISTFYEAPKPPEYPIESSSLEKTPTAEQEKAQRAYEASYREYEKQTQPYHRNVSIIALVSALVLLAAGLLLERRHDAISNGVVLASVFTLLYSIIRGFVSTDTKFTFVVVTVGVLIALYLGWRTFGQKLEAATTSKKIPTKRS